MRILVTGVSGQVGSAICRRFAALGQVVAADRTMLDLSKPHEIAGKLDKLRPDVIVNPAAYTAVDQAENEQELAFLVNAAGPAAIARWSALHDVPVVHFSTDYVFDGSGQAPWGEDDSVGPLNAYGASKLAGEEAVRAAAGSYLLVRTSWVYAASGNNFLCTIARLAQERKELRVVSDQIGSPTSASFIADVLTKIFRHNLSNLPKTFASANNVVHVAAGGETSWHGFAKAIINGLKTREFPVLTERLIPISTTDYPAKARRPLNSRLDLTRLHRVFGISPPPWTSLLEMELDEFAGLARQSRGTN